jgi:hypothetical protein
MEDGIVWPIFERGPLKDNHSQVSFNMISGFREDLNVKIYEDRRTDAKWWLKLTW